MTVHGTFFPLSSKILGGYYPVGYSFEEANKLIYENPKKFKSEVKISLKRHVEIVNKHVKRGTYFFDYGNAFLLEASKAEADILKKDGSFKYPSYVQDIMGPMCFDYGFGPFRWGLFILQTRRFRYNRHNCV